MNYEIKKDVKINLTLSIDELDDLTSKLWSLRQYANDGVLKFDNASNREYLKECDKIHEKFQNILNEVS
jgi:hypothetical protein